MTRFSKEFLKWFADYKAKNPIDDPDVLKIIEDNVDLMLQWNEFEIKNLLKCK